MLTSALIGSVVALCMWLPPIIHFVSGPLGPLVGGCVGGSRTRATPCRAAVIGLIMGLFMVAPVAGLVLLGSMADISFLPQGIHSALAYVGVVIVVYTGAMGTVGAAIGGRLALQQAAKEGADAVAGRSAPTR